MTQSDGPYENGGHSPLYRTARSAWLHIHGNRRRYVRNIAIAAVVGVAVAFLWPKSFTAKATILPSQQNSALSSMLAQVGGTIGAGLIGSTDESMVKLYPDILSSRRLLDEVLAEPRDSGTFLDHFARIKDDDPHVRHYLILKHIGDNFSASVDIRNQLVTVTFTDRDPSFAADFLNRLIIALNEFLQHQMKTNAKTERTAIKQRLDQVKAALDSSEIRLKDFEEVNRGIQTSPELQMRQGRLARDVEINSGIFVELTKQYEIAKIEELRTTPLVNELDSADIPAVKSGPKRALIVVLFILLGGAATLVEIAIVHRRTRAM